MKPTLDSVAVAKLKENLKEVGNLTLNLCGSGSPDPEVRDKAQKINKLAHEMYELILLEENSRKHSIEMQDLEEEGVKVYRCSMHNFPSKD